MERRIEAVKKKSILAHILIGLIKVYQYLTPWMNCCRFYPSCSEYSAEAIEKHGAIVGIILTIYRLLRCQPYCKAGFDPVPEKIRLKLKLKKEFKGENV